MTAQQSTGDQHARDRIRTDHGNTLFVMAGAGTGKTTALVSRVVALVAEGRTDLDDLAAITFTEAAAAELRDRIRSALELAAHGDDPHVVTAEGRSRCAHARTRIDDAALTTLHGFAQRLLSRFPIEAGVPPRFEVIDEIEAAIDFDEGWRALASDLLTNPELEEALLTALTLSVDMRRWRDIAAALHANWDRVPEPAQPFPPVPPVPLDITALLDRIDIALQLRAHCDAPDDRLLLKLDDLEAITAEFRVAQALGGLDLLETLFAYDVPTAGNAGVKGNWAVPKATVKAALDAAIAERTELFDAIGRAVLDAIGPRLAAWVRARARERTAAGRLEYHDLLVLARDLLRGDDVVRRAVAQRYRFVLIDEFQDTDPLQAELAALLAAAVDPSGQAWHEITVEPGRLFFVGDPKQSIYRFRRADLLLYHRAAERFGEHSVELATNFRSTPGVIAWVNDVFDGLLRESPEHVQATPAPLAAHREPMGEASDHAVCGPPVATFGAPDTDNAAQLRVREASDIAALVHTIVGQWRVVDPSTGEDRVAKRRDIALLLPTRTSLDAIDRAFDDADIPARVESRSLVFATAEVRDLLAILQAIDDPADSLAVVAALRSPGLACSDRALAEWALAGGRWDYRASAPDGVAPEHDVAVAMRTLDRLHHARVWRSVSDTIVAVIADCALDVVAVAHRRPRDRWRRTRFLLEHARAWDAAGDGATLRGFVEWAQRQADENATAIEMPAPEVDDDAVRILTMHGAKGLEFPIVILGGLGASPRTTATEVLFDDQGPLLRAGRRNMELASAGYAEQEAREKEHVNAERARLLYVAATRARDHLLVSQHYNARWQSTSFAAMLAPHLGRHPVPALDITDAATDVVGDHEHPAPTLDLTWTGAAPGTRPDVDVEYGTLVAADDERRAALVAASAPRAIAATRVRAVHDAHTTPAELEPGEQPAEIEEPHDLEAAARSPWPRGRAGTAIGRAVHAVLEHVDLETGADLDALAHAQARAEQIPAHEAQIATLARQMHESAVVGRAAARRHWREVPVATLVGDIVVEGYIDLLYEDDDGSLVVVDYKTDRVDDQRRLDHLVAHYTPQAATYALAIEATLTRPVARAELLFATADGAVARPVPDLAAAVDAVRALITAEHAQVAAPPTQVAAPPAQVATGQRAGASQ